jgi:two-component system, LytTR family, sensor kinase
MKKLLIISLLMISVKTYSQIDWSNYSTSFKKIEGMPSLGVAIPYNGIYDNFESNIVGISHWNPQYKLNIDTALDEQTPLFFVYDTVGIYFLVPQLNESNTNDFEFTVLLNNKTTITPWSHIGQFAKENVGRMKAGSGISGNYRAAIGQYLVAHLRNKAGQIISSSVIYFKRNAPAIRSLSTSDNALVFSNVIDSKNHFNESKQDVGWHRQYTSNLSGNTDKLKLAYNENNVLIDIVSKIYKKDALEYAVFKGDKEIRKWDRNEYNNHFILLKNLDPGDYRILIRFKRQRGSISELRFSVSSVWYKTAAFRVAVLIFLTLAVAFFIFLSKYRNQKKALMTSNKKAQQSAEELKNIHALLNPHFTFNALSSIQGLVNKRDIDGASKYLSSFGELLREALKESKTDLIPLTKELQNLQIYVGLEQLRYPFIYNVDVDRNIDLYSSTIPPFLLQPFVENSIKHGFSKMNGQGVLNIRIDRNGDTMAIKLTDNGPGFDPSLFKEGYGMSLSRKRIELLNRGYGENLIELQIEGTGRGTLILLSLKNWL